MLLLFVIVVLFTTLLCNSVVNLGTNGEAWYCNSNPLDHHPISPLSVSDIVKINKLEQVHVMTRHGARTHWDNFQRYFPYSKQYYHCNISTITSRIQLTSPNGEKYFVPMLTKYEKGNQYLYNSNCQHMQSLPVLINQHRQNAQILINTYMSSDDEPFHLFNINTLNAQKTSSKYMKFYTSNWERCMLSTMAIATKLFNITSITNHTSLHPMIETITNDLEFNPYTPATNAICSSQPQFQKWMKMSNTDLFDNYIHPKQHDLKAKQQHIIDEYIKQGGKWYDTPYNAMDHAGFQIVLFYCNGFDIPLSDDTFWNMVNAGVEWISIQPDKNNHIDDKEIEYAKKHKCIDHFMSIPMYKRFLDDIQAVINDKDDKKKFILHSAHDSTIKLFLSGLNLYDGMFPYFAQFLTLEIYSINEQWSLHHINPTKQVQVKWLFRFTNKGEFIPYEYCEKEWYQNEDLNNTELCDLNILLNNGFNDSINITQREWAEKRCKTLLDDCICGYCNDTIVNDTNISNDQNIESLINKQWRLDQFNFIFGIIVGCIGTIIIMFGIKYCITNCCNQCCTKWRMRKQYKETVLDYEHDNIDDSDANIEMEDIDNNQLFSGPDDKTTQK